MINIGQSVEIYVMNLQWYLPHALVASLQSMKIKCRSYSNLSVNRSAAVSSSSSHNTLYLTKGKTFWSSDISGQGR